MPAAWNLLLYAIAGKPEELARIDQAVADMHAALVGEQCNIAVQVHAHGHTTRHWLAAGHPVHTERLPRIEDASRQATLTKFLDDANAKYPAAASALVLWAHGAGLDNVHDYPAKHGKTGGLGPTPGSSRRHSALLAHSAVLGYDVLRVGARPGQPVIVGGKPDKQLDFPSAPRSDRFGCRWGPDPNTGHDLTNVNMKQAIAASTRGKVDVLALNACWMAALEVEYELRNVAELEVASQVYAEPWPYGELIAALCKAPPPTAEHFARAIVGVVHADILAGKRHDAVSATRAGKPMEALANALDPYARRVTAMIESDWQAVYDAVMTHAQRLDDPYQVDLRSLIHTLGKDDKEASAAAAQVANQLEAMVLASAADKSHPGVHGVSLFCPKSTHVDLIDAYQGTDFRTHAWAKFLVKFQRRTSSS
jgi:hypothetical protein